MLSGIQMDVLLATNTILGQNGWTVGVAASDTRQGF